MAPRTVLFTPGDNAERMRKAVDSDADIAIFDLEDAIAPDRKQHARNAIRSVLQDLESDRICVRVNPPGFGAEEDLAAILEGSPPSYVMLPKTNSVEDVRELAALIEQYEMDLPIFALIETAQGVLAADVIANARSTEALLFGAEDLAADLGATRTREGIEVLYARERVVLAARAAGIHVIDTVYTDYEDLPGLREEAAFAAQLGFDGKMVIHPAQIEVVNEAFTPSDERIEWANRVLTAAAETDAAVFQVGGEMIDAPLIQQAERILDRAGKSRPR